MAEKLTPAQISGMRYAAQAAAQAKVPAPKPPTPKATTPTPAQVSGMRYAAQAESQYNAAQAATNANAVTDANAKAVADANAKATADANAKIIADANAKAAADAAIQAAADAAAQAARDAAAADAAILAAKNAEDLRLALAAKAAADAAAANAKAALDAANAANAGTNASIKALQDQINLLTNQLTTKTAADTALAEQKAFEEKQRKENAVASLTARFSKYNLQTLIPKIKELVINGSTEATIALELAETEEYKERFKANTERLKKGLSVLDPGTYIGLEDSYRQALRAYGLKQFDTDDYVSQFIANDISANELSNRIVTAVQRVQNADPAITKQLKDFYNIGQNDLVAYVLDPNQQFQKIERQVQAAEIGVAAARQGITAGVQVAEQLAAQGVTQAEAQKGYATIADILPDAKRLSDIYGTTLEGYDLGQAEQEVFNQLASAQRRRQKLTQREIAAFSGSSGTNKTSLTTSAVGQF
jgi:hypothetical protein